MTRFITTWCAYLWCQWITLACQPALEKNTVIRRLIQSSCEMKHEGSLILIILCMKTLDGLILLPEESEIFKCPQLLYIHNHWPSICIITICLDDTTASHKIIWQLTGLQMPVQLLGILQQHKSLFLCWKEYNFNIQTLSHQWHPFIPVCQKYNMNELLVNAFVVKRGHTQIVKICNMLH